MDIQKNILSLQEVLKNAPCKLVAVSKTKPVESIKKAYEAGLRDFGENKVQELTEKYDKLPQDITWHMIGHLQRNKVKYIAPFIGLIHSVDSLKLLKEIDKEAAKNKRVISCLLQMHIAEEETKFGLSKEELESLLKSEDFKKLKSIKILGLMGMATFTENKAQIRKEFKSLKNLFDDIKNQGQHPNLEMKECSLGMTSDYKIAIEEGSTMVRVGSAIFGSRGK